jgi:hypothetical protein
MLKGSPALFLLSIAFAAYSSSTPRATNPNFDGKSWWEYVKGISR